MMGKHITHNNGVYKLSKVWNTNSKLIYGVALSLFVIALHFTYIRNVLPPQTGWWQYYGWQVCEGKKLYTDIYCYLPPYFVWFMAGLWKLLGINLFAYQILGIIIRAIIALLIYSILTRSVSVKVAYLSVAVGMVIQCSYQQDMPFDYNPIMMFLAIVAAYFGVLSYESKNKKKSYFLIYCVGIVNGIHLMSKQSSGLVVVFVTAIGILLLFNKNEAKKPLAYLSWYVFGIIFACAPGLIILITNGSYTDFVQNVFYATQAKGSISVMMGRIINSAIEPIEIVFSVVAVALIALINSGDFRLQGSLAAGRVAKGILLRLLFSFTIVLFTYRIYTLFGGGLGLVSVLIIFLSGMVKFCDYVTKQKEDLHILEANKLYYDIAFELIVVLGFILYTYVLSNAFDRTKMGIFGSQLPRLIIREFMLVIFWGAVVLLIVQIIQAINHRTLRLGTSFFILLAIAVAFGSTTLLSATLETLVMLPITACVCAAILSINFNRRLLTRCITGILCLVLITAVVSSKQAEPYSWNGWTSESRLDEDNNFTSSNMQGLSGYCLDEDTIRAYTAIVNIISDLTDENDAVFQFPHVVLFNLLSQRQTGTYPVSLWLDVCPDYIAEAEVKRLYKEDPAVVIWDEIYDWDFCEEYFRGENRSGQQLIRDYYEHYIKREYVRAYSYKEISVWVRIDILGRKG